MSKPLDVDGQSFGREVLEGGTGVLVDFWSQTCPHCLLLAPHFEAAAEQHGERVKFVKVSVQDARPLFAECGVHAVPTLVFFLEGAEVARRGGVATSEEIASWLAPLCGATGESGEG